MFLNIYFETKCPKNYIKCQNVPILPHSTIFLYSTKLIKYKKSFGILHYWHRFLTYLFLSSLRFSNLIILTKKLPDYAENQSNLVDKNTFLNSYQDNCFFFIIKSIQQGQTTKNTGLTQKKLQQKLLRYFPVLWVLGKFCVNIQQNRFWDYRDIRANPRWPPCRQKSHTMAKLCNIDVQNSIQMPSKSVYYK